MTRQSRTDDYDALKFARLLMVLSSLAPLFLLWAIRGNGALPDIWFVPGCVLLALLPNCFLLWRILSAQQNDDTRQLVVGASEDHRNHVLTYLFTILLPFYRQELDSARDLVAMIVALIIIVYLFWWFNLHYMNIVFVFWRYKVFTISSPQNKNPYTGREPLVLITRRSSVMPNDRILVYRMSDTVYLEKNNVS